MDPPKYLGDPNLPPFIFIIEQVLEEVLRLMKEGRVSGNGSIATGNYWFKVNDEDERR